MDNYEKMYYLLFNRITDIIEQLKSIQQISEEMFITYTENEQSSEQHTIKT